MAIPVVIPNTFANATASIPLSQLDANFNALANVFVDLNSGAQQLANANVATIVVNSNNISADNSLGFRNRIINGDTRIAQRGTASVNANGAYPVDRFQQLMSGGGVLTSQSSTTTPAGFTNSIYTTVSTADASIASTDYYLLRHVIEGLNVADLGWGSASATTVTLSFKVRSSVTGTFSGSLTNSAEDRCYPFTYSIGSADTWTNISVTVPGDTSGTWLTDNGVGIRINFDLGTGSQRLGTANTWGTSTYFGATGSVQLISTLNATFYITGVQLEVGSVATPFERRPYGTELALCQRYYQLAGMGLTYYNATGSQQGRFTGTPCVTPRTSPTFTLVSSNVVGNVSSATPSSYNSGATIHLQIVSSASSGSYTDANYTYSLSAEL